MASTAIQRIGVDLVPVSHRGEKLAEAEGDLLGRAVIGVQPFQIDFRVAFRNAVGGDVQGLTDFQFREDLPAV